MKQINTNDLKVINDQMLATALFIISLFISLSLLINQKRKIKNKNYFYSDKKVRYIAITNRIFIILIVLFYLYIDKENLDICNNSNIKKYRKMQCYLEIIYLIAAIIALYITIKSSNVSTDIENSNI